MLVVGLIFFILFLIVDIAFIFADVSPGKIFWAMLSLIGVIYCVNGLSEGVEAEWIWTIFAVGTFWFWALLATEFCFLMGCMSNENGILATVSLASTVALLNVFGSVPIVNYFFANIGTTLLYVAVYFVAGTIWSIVKWYSYVTDQRERYDDLKSAFLKKNQLSGSGIPGDMRSDWERTLQFGHDDGGCSVGHCECLGRPLASNHKKDILRWMAYWPFSLLWTVAFNWVWKIFNKIYQHIQNLLQSISDRKFRDTEADFAKPKAEDK
jgi:hypothetical protein